VFPFFFIRLFSLIIVSLIASTSSRRQQVRFITSLHFFLPSYIHRIVFLGSLALLAIVLLNTGCVLTTWFENQKVRNKIIRLF
jgi:hypothetical protein